jgi:hypothetical protein
MSTAIRRRVPRCPSPQGSAWHCPPSALLAPWCRGWSRPRSGSRWLGPRMPMQQQGVDYSAARGIFFFPSPECFTGSRRLGGAGARFWRPGGLARFLSKEALQCTGRFAQPFPPAWSLDGPAHCDAGPCPAAPPVSPADARLPYEPQGCVAIRDDAAGSRTETVVTTESGAGKLHHAAARTAAHKEDAAGCRTGPAIPAGPGTGKSKDVVPRNGANKDSAGSRAEPSRWRGFRARMPGGAGRASGRPRGFFVPVACRRVHAPAARVGRAVRMGPGCSARAALDAPWMECGDDHGERHP